jgi:hypothetical protein
MLTSTPEILVKELNKITKSWNLCNLFFKNIKNINYNIKVVLFIIFN